MAESGTSTPGVLGCDVAKAFVPAGQRLDLWDVYRTCTAPWSKTIAPKRIYLGKCNSSAKGSAVEVAITDQ